ncbi:uncharacterized protein HD556DRAFT_899124 [Suillus plorans]|uniref:T6SS Phospholipase effector Tle1-like catalytic domain-containing protein n=1 Tax=Suillus plorans TaxID=116603 RepID=A0A9P7J430_9AGAM|nr:uncharacterized protein HD556DRAFT_899124 [Suillus plorans]KAG1801667.1 hypothetical protein HD556DRAFT_899124 [Suillus plorans]
MITARVELDVAQLPRASSEPFRVGAKFKKRIIVCCDGTWQDGLIAKECWQQTNILKLSRGLEHVDERSGVLIPQVVYYQCGVGTGHNIYSEYVDGATGGSLGEKVQEAYGFIAQNYHPGDEIFLFGFSRGAYTARMVAMFIGAIGVLDRTDMDSFASIFIAYQKLGKETDQREIEKLDALLSHWTSPDSRGKTRARSDNNTFSIKCVGVFDTVGSVGLPEELTHKSPSTKSIFGFPNNELGEHIERAYHALAINETRLDFDCCKFVQTDGGRRKGQVLKQCWFSGEHSDIGGGWQKHDLSDITLAWMVANIGDILSIDTAYISSLSDPVAPWGEQPPHDPRTGIFVLSDANVRKLPTVTDDITHETIHPSVLRQKHSISSNPALLCNLLPLEEELQKKWPYIEGKHELDHQVNGVVHTRSVSWTFSSVRQANRVGTHSDRDIPETQVTIASQTTDYDTSLFGSLRHLLGPLAQL